MKTILVLFGGCSTEYEVSLHSAYAVLSHMDPARYTPLAVGITREGQWLCYTGDLSRLEDGTWQQAADCIPCTPLVEREAHALLLLDGSGRRLLFDAVFPVLHGKNGEDGTVQGLFELAGVPVIGCGTLSSALCMDKDRAHKLASLAGVLGYGFLGLFSSLDGIGADPLLGLLLGLGGLMGSYLGARCQRFVPARRIKWGLALILLFTSLRYLWQGL